MSLLGILGLFGLLSLLGHLSLLGVLSLLGFYGGGGRKITINNVFRSFEQKETMFLGFLVTVLCLLSLSSLLGLLSWGEGANDKLG